jgi:hypothetical protein
VTFYALDEHSKLDVRGKEFPRGAWTKTAPTEAKPRKRWHAGRVNSSPINPPAVLPPALINAN